jgi:hypothetical protein
LGVNNKDVQDANADRCRYTRDRDEGEGHSHCNRYGQARPLVESGADTLFQICARHTRHIYIVANLSIPITVDMERVRALWPKDDFGAASMARAETKNAPKGPVRFRTSPFPIRS